MSTLGVDLLVHCLVGDSIDPARCSHLRFMVKCGSCGGFFIYLGITFMNVDGLRVRLGRLQGRTEIRALHQDLLSPMGM